MKLLQREIDVLPGQRPTMQPNMDGRLLRNSGTAVLELFNDSDYENSFSVGVRAESPEGAWVAAACQVETLKAVAGYQDVREHDRLKVYAAQGTTRQLALKINVPQRPESRAGVYDLTVTVECSLPVRVGTETKSRFEFPVRAIVRPFYSWRAAVQPEALPVRILRPRGIAWATVENQGNDWLYCELKLPKKGGQIEFERDTELIAVPPAVSSGEASVRRIPIRVRSRYKTVRGSAIPTPIPLQAVQVDAPSVPRFPGEESEALAASAELGNPVTTKPGRDTKVVSGSSVVFHPPIPATLAGFVTGLRTNLMALFSLFLMGLATFYAASFMYEHAVHRLETGKERGKVNAQPSQVPPGGTLTLNGNNLNGCDVALRTEKGPLDFDVLSRTEDKVVLRVGADIPLGTEASVNVSRRGFGLLSWPPIFPSASVNVTIGQKPVEKKFATIDVVADARVEIGQELTLKPAGEQGFGKNRGRVEIGTVPLQIVSWSNEMVKARVPDDPNLAAPAATVVIRMADGAGSGKCAVEIVDPNAVVPGTNAGDLTDGTTATGGTDGTGGSTGGDGSSGGSEGGTGSSGNTAAAPTASPELLSTMTAALRAHDRDAILQAAATAESQGAYAVAVYGYLAGGRTSKAQELHPSMVEGEPTADSSPLDKALYRMAEAEYRRLSEGQPDEARRMYRSLAGEVRDMDGADLVKEAIKRSG